MNLIVSKLNHLWRVIATGYSFLFFGFFGLFITVSLLPLARLTARDANNKNLRARKLVKVIWQFFVWQMKFLGLISVEVEGQEYLDNAEGKLVIANHPSLIDVVLLIAAMPRACCVVKEALWKNPYLKGVVRAMGYISNISADELLGGSQREFDAGNAILVFPEGTRSPWDAAAGGGDEANAELKFQRGAANIAARCGADIVPVFIRVEPPTLRRGEPWYRVAPRRVQYVLAAQPPICIDEVTDESVSAAKNARELTRYLESYFNRGLRCNEI